MTSQDPRQEKLMRFDKEYDALRAAASAKKIAEENVALFIDSFPDDIVPPERQGEFEGLNAKRVLGIEAWLTAFNKMCAYYLQGHIDQGMFDANLAPEVNQLFKSEAHGELLNGAREAYKALWEVHSRLNDRQTSASHGPGPTGPAVASASDTARHQRALIMKGGGAKGLAYVGALDVLEKLGIEFDTYVGTSAGAITAALLAAGFKASDFKLTAFREDYGKFASFRPTSLFSLLFLAYANSGNGLERWLEKLLEDAGIKKGAGQPAIYLSRLKKRFVAFASSTNAPNFVFDSALPAHSQVPVVAAVRASSAIPYVFKSVYVLGHEFVDGGVRNNFPVKIFLEENPGFDFVGMYLVNSDKDPWWTSIPIVKAARNISSISMGEGSDEKLIEKYLPNVIKIDPSPISTTDFVLSEVEKDYLFAAGRAAALTWASNNRRLGPFSQESAFEAVDKANDLKIKVVAARERAEIWRRRRNLALLCLIVFGAGVYFYFYRLPPRQGPPVSPSPGTNLPSYSSFPQKIEACPPNCPPPLPPTKADATDRTDIPKVSGVANEKAPFASTETHPPSSLNVTKVATTHGGSLGVSRPKATNCCKITCPNQTVVSNPSSVTCTYDSTREKSVQVMKSKHTEDKISDKIKGMVEVACKGEEGSCDVTCSW